MQNMNERVASYFLRLEKEQFFGTVEVQLNKGDIVFIRETKSIKPSDLE